MTTKKSKKVGVFTPSSNKKTNISIRLDSVKLKLTAPDIDGDGKTGGTEVIERQFDQGVSNITQNTEIADMMMRMFPDSNTASTKMLGNMNWWQTNSSLSLLILNKMKVVSSIGRDIVLEAILLSVSESARGRDDGVNIMAGKRENDAKASGFGSIGEGMKNFFTGGQK